MLRPVVHSGLLVAAVAVTLLLASSLALEHTPGAGLITVVFAGTLAVYTFDRLVDDHVGRPARERFARRHRRGLVVVGAIAAIVGVAFGLLALSRVAIALLGGVVALAAVHGRLRRFAWIKPIYIAVAWCAVVVGLPALLSGAPAGRVVADLAPIALALIANVLACDAADREAEALLVGVRALWWTARAVAVTGVVAAATGPLPELIAVPGAVLLASYGVRPESGHASTVVDAALGLGGLIAFLSLLRS